MRNEHIEFTPTQQKALAFAPKPSAALSFLASIYIIAHVLRNPTKRKRMYHRLMLGMSANSLVQSVFYFLGTWPMPKDVPGFYGGVGTVETCTAQGFILQFAFAVPFYYASLSLYAFLAVRNDFNEARIVWIEKYIHVGVYVVPIVTAIGLLKKEMFNPKGAWCWIESYPMACEGDQCIRGKDSRQVGMLFAGIPMFTFLGFATLMMILLYWTEKRRTLEKISSVVSGKTRFLEEARRRKSRLVARQASFYLAAFYLTYSFGIVFHLIELQTGEKKVALLIIGTCFVPLMGFLNMIVYFHLQLRRKTPTRRRSSLLRAASCLMTPITTTSYVVPAKETSNTIVENVTGEPDQEWCRDDFSIFDGSNPSSRWKEFIFDDDEDEDEEDTSQNCELA